MNFYTDTQFKKLVLARLLSENFLVFLMQYSGLMMSALACHSSPIWLASGTACAFIFLRGYSVLFGIWLGSAVAYYFAGADFLLACSCASVYAIQAFLILWLSHRYITPTLIFYRKMTALKFILCTGIVTLFISVWLAAMCYVLSTYWFEWWLANFNGILIIACALITWDAYVPQISLLKAQNKWPLILLFGLITILSIILLFIPFSQVTYWLAMVAALSAIGTGVYLGKCGAITCSFIIGIILVFGAYFGVPLFDTEMPTDAVILLQVMLSMIAMVGLVVTS